MLAIRETNSMKRDGALRVGPNLNWMAWGALVVLACSSTAPDAKIFGIQPTDTEPQMSDDSYAQAMATANDALCAMAGFYGLSVALAAPKMIAKLKRCPSRDEMLEVVDRYLKQIESAKKSPKTTGNEELITVEPQVIPLRAMLAAWTPSYDVPDHIKKQARAVLEALGVDVPSDGWDLYEGNSQ